MKSKLGAAAEKSAGGWGKLGWDHAYGHGRVNFFKAVQ
jgi:hypothetical protein